MSDPSPHSPAPAYPPSGSREPDWTTGQGIGFLVALPGWVMVGLGVLAALIGGFVSPDAEAFGRIVAAAVAVGVVGLLAALPGTIVFNKCKRR